MRNVAPVLVQSVPETHCPTFYLRGSAKSANAAAGAVFVTVDMRAVNVDANAFLKRMETTHMAAPSYIRFVSYACSKVSKKPIIKMRSLELAKCAFTCNLAFFFILVM